MSQNDNNTPESPPDKKSPFSFLNSSLLTDFSDHQRLERLKQCREIEHVLHRCKMQQTKNEEVHKSKRGIADWMKRANKKPNNNTHSPATCPYSTDELEQTVPGLRMTHYFGWRQTSAVRVGDAVVREKQEMQKEESLTCARETHCLWACRSIALGCAPHLTKLKQCFQQYEQDAVLSMDQTAYDEKSRKSITVANVIPCREIQEELGACVTGNAVELQRRRQQKTKEEGSPS